MNSLLTAQAITVAKHRGRRLLPRTTRGRGHQPSAHRPCPPGQQHQRSPHRCAQRVSGTGPPVHSAGQGRRDRGRRPQRRRREPVLPGHASARRQQRGGSQCGGHPLHQPRACPAAADVNAIGRRVFRAVHPSPCRWSKLARSPRPISMRCSSAPPSQPPRDLNRRQ